MRPKREEPGDKHQMLPEGFLPKAEKFFDKDDGVMLVVILRVNKVLLVGVVLFGVVCNGHLSLVQCSGGMW